MTPRTQTNITEMTPKERVALFFQLIRQRQLLEKKYDRSQDPRLLSKIEEIRCQIKEVKGGMGIEQ